MPIKQPISSGGIRQQPREYSFEVVLLPGSIEA
jgi:hypothetical protein